MLAAIAGINTKIRSHPVSNYVFSTRTYMYSPRGRASERYRQLQPSRTPWGCEEEKRIDEHILLMFNSFFYSRFLGPSFQFLSPCRSTLGHTEKRRDVSPPASELIRVIPALPSVRRSQKRTCIDLSPSLCPQQHLRTNDLILTLRLGSFYAIRTRRATKELSSLCMSLCELFGAERAGVSVYVVLALGWEREGRAAAIRRWL